MTDNKRIEFAAKVMGWTFTQVWVDRGEWIDRDHNLHAFNAILTSADAQWQFECAMRKKHGVVFWLKPLTWAYKVGVHTKTHLVCERTQQHDNTPASILAARGRAMVDAAMAVVAEEANND